MHIRSRHQTNIMLTATTNVVNLDTVREEVNSGKKLLTSTITRPPSCWCEHWGQTEDTVRNHVWFCQSLLMRPLIHVILMMSSTLWQNQTWFLTNVSLIMQWMPPRNSAQWQKRKQNLPRGGFNVRKCWRKQSLKQKHTGVLHLMTKLTFEDVEMLDNKHSKPEWQSSSKLVFSELWYKHSSSLLCWDLWQYWIDQFQPPWAATAVEMLH